MGLTIKSAQDLQAEAKAEQLAHVREEARRYLSETDWMVVRATETGKPVPDDVAKARAAARNAAKEQR